jgi:arsenate reductase (thioredoxin)
LISLDGPSPKGSEPPAATACPVVPGIERDDWPLEDPKGRSLGRVRKIRGEVETRVHAMLE